MRPQATAAEKRLMWLLYGATLGTWFIGLMVFFFGHLALEAPLSMLLNSGLPLVEHYSQHFQSYAGDWKLRLGALYLVFMLSPLPILAGCVFSVKILDKHRRPYLSYKTTSILGRIATLFILLPMIFFGVYFLAGKDMVISLGLVKRFDSVMLLVPVLGFWALGGTLGLLICDTKALIYRDPRP